MRTRAWAMLSGVVAAVLGLGVAEVLALLVAPRASPVSAVGSLLIDLAPPFVKDAMIAAFGTADKAVLVGLVLVGVIVLSALAGVVEFRRRYLGTALVGLGAVVGGIALITRSGFELLWLVPLVLAAAVAARVLFLLVSRLWHADGASGSPQAGSSRRIFLRTTVIAGAAAVILGGAATFGRTVTGVAQAARDRIRLPRAASPAPVVPAGAELDVDGLARYVSSNSGFYRIDTAIVVPRVDPSTWKLRIHGLVAKEFELDFEQLLALPLVERWITLTCVSNEVGGDLIGNARWLGYPVRKLLARVSPSSRADMVLSRSTDGFTAGTPLEVLQDPDRDALLAVGMNGQPLPDEHGFPVRLVVPGLYGYVSATKWVSELELTRFDRASAYWTDRGWSAKGPIKTQSRIDVPKDAASVDAGTVTVAGVAWAQHTGIEKVEVRIDGDPWREARLASSVSVDTWTQWSLTWDAPTGQHRIQVRATDRDGSTQTSRQQGTVPNGATGYHTIRVTVR